MQPTDICECLVDAYHNLANLGVQRKLMCLAFND